MLAIGADLSAGPSGSRKDGHQATGRNAEEGPSSHAVNPIGNATIPVKSNNSTGNALNHEGLRPYQS
jgi:hypothetical protein